MGPSFRHACPTCRTRSWPWAGRWSAWRGGWRRWTGGSSSWWRRRGTRDARWRPAQSAGKFPDLLQQVIYETCDSSECEVLHGECIQTYVPYLFLVIPLGPVTLTGQDYVLVESGCTCRPKYATPGT